MPVVILDRATNSVTITEVTYLKPPVGTVQEEILWRGRVYERLQVAHPPRQIPPSALREAGVYGGAAGLWCDRERTIRIAESGLCVSLLHTGKHYADSFLGNTLVYHYPQTKRPGATDINEIHAARECLRSRVPLFVILPGDTGSTKELRLGWLVGDMPDEKAFLIALQDNDPGRIAMQANT
jgi:hypothetical protein